VSEAPHPRVLGVLLAGGQNRRYGGAPKALASVAGEPIAARAARALEAAAGGAVLVTNDPDTYRSLGLKMRPDVRPGLGALGGILTAVAWAEETGCRGALVAACDMPFLSPGLLALLVADADRDAVVAPASDSRRGLEPLCAFYGVGCRAAIEAALARGERHVTSFFPEVTVRTLSAKLVAEYGDPEVLFLNVNTPADRERAEAVARAAKAGR